MKTQHKALALMLAVLPVLSACTVGPNYREPTMSVPARFDAPAPAPAPAQAGGEGDLASWWKRFDDPVLDSLVDSALAQNVSLAVAASRLREARLQQVIAGAQGKPTLGLTGGFNNTRFSKNAGLSSLGRLFGGGGSSGSGGGITVPGGSISTYSAGFDASWELDLFGGARRGREAALASEEASQWSARDTEVTLIAELADDYLKLRAAQCEGGVLGAQLESAGGVLKIVEASAASGVSAGSAGYQQQQTIAATQASIEANTAQQQSLRRQIALLLAEPVDQLPAAMAAAPADCQALALPAVAPGLPSELLRRRPDVRAAERQLAAATAQIGVATADLYPKLSLTGVAELLSTGLSNLITGNSVETIAGASGTFPILDFGRGRAKVGVARAEADQAYLTYRQTVVTAFSEVGGALEQMQAEQARLAALQASLGAARQAETSALALYRTGLSDFTPVYQAQASRQTAELNVLASQAAEREQLVMLYKALGGGWSDTVPAGQPVGSYTAPRGAPVSP